MPEGTSGRCGELRNASRYGALELELRPSHVFFFFEAVNSFLVRHTQQWAPGPPGCLEVPCTARPTRLGQGTRVLRGVGPPRARTHTHTEKREKRTIMVPCSSPYCVRLSVVSARSLADPLSFLSGM